VIIATNAAKTALVFLYFYFNVIFFLRYSPVFIAGTWKL